MDGDIEFVPTDPAWGDGGEDVLELGRQGLSQRVVWTLLLVLAVVIGTVWLAARPGGSRPTAAVPTVAPSSQANQSPPGVAPTRPEIREFSCPGAALCVISTRVPPQLRRAVRHYDPRLSSITVRSIVRQGGDVGNGPLRSRQVDAHVGAAEVIIRVGQYRRSVLTPSVPLALTPPRLASVFLHIETPAYVIDLQWIGRGTALPPLDRLHTLAVDPRLEVQP